MHIAGGALPFADMLRPRVARALQQGGVTGGAPPRSMSGSARSSWPSAAWSPVLEILAVKEVGIDIGDIDLVALAEPPWSVTALVQRIGRGCRRTGCIQAAALAASPADRTIIEAMFEAAVDARLEVEAYRPDLSVIVQQALPIAFQWRGEGVREERIINLLRVLAPPEPAPRCLPISGSGAGSSTGAGDGSRPRCCWTRPSAGTSMRTSQTPQVITSSMRRRGGR